MALVVLLAALYLQLSGYDVDDDLDAATRADVKQLLSSAPTLPNGDAGFLRLVEQAFTFAAGRSRGSDPVLQNKAAVLAIALVLGHEKLAGLADRNIDVRLLPACDSLRARLTVHERPDWLRHFCVSAGLGDKKQRTTAARRLQAWSGFFWKITPCPQIRRGRHEKDWINFAAFE